MPVTGYENRLRPAQPETPAADAFEIHRAEVADGLSLAYVREDLEKKDAAGQPLVEYDLLLDSGRVSQIGDIPPQHGFPATPRGNLPRDGRGAREPR